MVTEQRRERDRTWFQVRVDEQRFDVSVSARDASALAPTVAGVDLIRESFRFLLEREPVGSILQSFDLSVIQRYFPEYRDEIRRRTSR